MLSKCITIGILLLGNLAYAQENVVQYEERTLSLLNEELRSLNIDEQIKRDGHLDLHDYQIDNVATPTASTDGVNKAYVDGKTSCVLGFASSGGVGIAAGTTKYAAFFGGAFGTTNWNTTEANRQHILPYAGTAKNLYIRTTGAQPSAGNLVFKVRKNGADTALTITVVADEAAGTKTDTTNTVTFAVGDLICLEGANGDGVDTSALINQWSLEYVK